MVLPALGVLGTLLLVAQSSKPVKSAFDIGTGRLLVLLQEEPLQDELRIPSGRRAALKEWAEAQLDRGLATAEAMDQVAREFHLDPEARRRLEEVRLQILGGHALLLDEQVAKRLHLSDQQEKQLDRVRERNTSAFRALGRELNALRFGSIEAREKYKDPTRLKTGEALLAVLTPEQRAEFSRMQGRAFPPLKGAGAPGGK
jgi:Spy/CpxP family protein refolding chaperone